MPERSRRVVVTGLGVICPLGNTIKETWENILAGKSGIKNIDSFDTSQFSTKFAGLVQNFDITKFAIRVKFWEL